MMADNTLQKHPVWMIMYLGMNHTSITVNINLIIKTFLGRGRGGGNVYNVSVV